MMRNKVIVTTENMQIINPLQKQKLRFPDTACNATKKNLCKTKIPNEYRPISDNNLIFKTLAIKADPTPPKKLTPINLNTEIIEDNWTLFKTPPKKINITASNK